MSQQDTRAAFEVWCRKEQGYLYKDEAEPGTPQEDKWLGFQAGAAHAASAQSAQVAQGELPLLPKGTWFACDHESGVQFHPSEEQAKRYAIDGTCEVYFSADQMRTYGQRCAEAARQPAPAVAVKTWQEQMCENADASNVIGSPQDFMRQEIRELRAALAAATNRSQP